MCREDLPFHAGYTQYPTLYLRGSSLVRLKIGIQILREPIFLINTGKPGGDGVSIMLIRCSIRSFKMMTPERWVSLADH
jgi:hypothetical protein